MMDLFSAYTLTQWALIILAAFCIGMGKAGLKGIDMVGIIIMAIIFGGKLSTGIVLPLLSMGDIAAVSYYNRHAQWKHFWKLIPWMAVGILLGVYFGKDMNEVLFRQIMVFTIFVTVGIVLWMEFRSMIFVPDNKLFAAGTGLTAGFTTMIGNLAGAFANLYFLAMRLPKNDFIGTTAWIFLVINLFKMPFQVFYWKNIDLHTFKTDLMLLPAVALGFWLGIMAVRKIKEEQYRKLVIFMTLAGSLFMLFKR
jgi:uncharacterized membrane protein YfcA